MEGLSPKDGSVVSSTFPSPSISILLKIKILSWIQETGSPVSITVRVADRTFHLHKYPLFSKSGYLRKRLIESTEIELPKEFPGGPEMFEMIALLVYGSSTLIDPFNIAALRCASEFLEMTEDYASGNLCARFDLYLNQVVLQSWDDTLIVLQKCQSLSPWSEKLLIVSRCIESLAFMACMEILDPERRREHPVVTLDDLSRRAWSSEIVKEIVCQDLWIKDLIALPFGFFKRIIWSLRRQGMKDKYVSPIIVFYANKWIISKKTRQFWENSGDQRGEDDTSIILQGVLDLLPKLGEKASRVIPVGFYLALLSRSLEVGLKRESESKLQDHVASLLHFAQVEDFLIPKDGDEIDSKSKQIDAMGSIFSKYVASYMNASNAPFLSNSIVADLWDLYLSRIASDSEMGSKRFMDLIENLPISTRQSHDYLYRAINNFLQAHPKISQEEKGSVCKYLNCQKLSQESCVEAVQNELMPLRLIVQALFIQQLNTHQALKECSDSFRYTNCGELSGSYLSSSRCPTSKVENQADSPYLDAAMQSSEFSRKEYESTSFRIQNLEQELVSLKNSLQSKTISKKQGLNQNKVEKVCGLGGRSMSSKTLPVEGDSNGCIGPVNFASRRKYASGLLKVLRKVLLFGNGKSKRKQYSTT